MRAPIAPSGAWRGRRGGGRRGQAEVLLTGATEDTGALIAAFEKRHGIKVRLWRGGSEAILTRAINENRGGRADVDVIETAGPEMEALTREKLLAPFAGP